MILSNFERMVQLADQVFATKNDPEQLDVNPDVIKRLQMIHPSTVMQFDDVGGPVAWVLLLPTTLGLMKMFVENEISEKELFEQTPLDSSYEALYLCSALVLEEYRRKGIVKNLTLEAIGSIKKQHPLKALFVWPFSPEGDLASETIARLSHFPLLKRKEKN
jgi:hypothetical protein